MDYIVLNFVAEEIENDEENDASEICEVEDSLVRSKVKNKVYICDAVVSLAGFVELKGTYFKILHQDQDFLLSF